LRLLLLIRLTRLLLLTLADFLCRFRLLSSRLVLLSLTLLLPLLLLLLHIGYELGEDVGIQEGIGVVVVIVVVIIVGALLLLLPLLLLLTPLLGRSLTQDVQPSKFKEKKKPWVKCRKKP